MIRILRNIISVFPVLLLAAQGAAAQTGINSTVEVERDYEGRIARTVKSPLDAPVDDSLLNFKLNFDYSTFYSPYKDLYEFTPMMTLGPASEGRIVYPWLYARVAAAYPWTPSADVYVSPRLGEKFSLGAYFNHDSYWGRVPQVALTGGDAVYSGRKAWGDRMKNKTGAFMGFRWKKGELKLDASYSGSMYALAQVSGSPSHQDILNMYSNKFDHLRAGLSVRSTNPDPSAFYYDLNVAYRYFSNRQGVLEHLADADVSLGATVKREHKVYLRFSGTFYNFGLWKISPTYRWEHDRWRVRAGLAFSSVYGGNIRRSGNGFLIYPDASVRFEAARNALWLYLNLSGDNRMYTRYDLFAVNPWMDNSGAVYQSAVPVSAELGLNGLVRDRFSYSLGVNYSMARNHLSYLAISQAQSWYQTVDLQDSHILTVTGRLKWQSPAFRAQAELNYRGFSNRDAELMTPAFDVDAVMEYNLRQRLFIRADCYFRTSTVGWSAYPYDQASVYRVPSFVDVGLRISYAVNTHVMVFVEGNNLANSKIQYFLNYIEPGINIGAGICLKL